ncbi:phosphoethanolamine--lipid A transferase EptA [Maribellus mangrovi]|uniref:phosphoethanolamine--lipid A transferase EptA n=1 Tax=Maribellus mangrovi TaxID=3133146 RepID=UPI0030EE7386
MFKRKIKLIYYALIVSFLNLILYHFSFYKFVYSIIDIKTLNGVLLLISLLVLTIALNALVFYIGVQLLRKVGKWLLVLFFNINAVAVYFINTYSVIIDKSMIGNVLNTNYEEASSFFSITFLIYIIFLGIIPSILLLKIKVKYANFKRFGVQVAVTLVLLLALVYANATNWLWIDKNSKKLGALVMPWSYVVNTSRYYHSKNKKNKEQILLPDATARDSTKSVVVLVIGESARSANFSLYGYPRNTNPELEEIDNLHVYPAESAATYTTEGIKSILEHKKTGKLYEILPNYLYRNGFEVIWRTTNWGEPTVKIKDYQTKEELINAYNKEDFEYDEILLYGLKDEILDSEKNKIFIVLHTSTSHGPAYYKKYPPEFNQFTPVCKSVELAKCTQQELINAYDNTILYTDHILTSLIEELEQLEEYNTSMIFISDHGESLGEKNLYMHGIPLSIAPKEQYEIPFIVWASNNSLEFKDRQLLSQHHVFHTVLDLLEIDSPVYDENMSILKK